MKTIDEQIADTLKVLLANYISSIELPKNRHISKKDVQSFNAENIIYYNNGYNICLRDCQAKLDEVVKGLRR